ncbi:hypothetical protein B0H14DRAFT_2864433, partial [Mycena olivaceomarginata]
AGSAAPSGNEPQPLAAGVGAEGRDDDEARVAGSGAGKASGSDTGSALNPHPLSSHAAAFSGGGGARDGEVGLAGLEVGSGAVEAARARGGRQTRTRKCVRGGARVRCGVGRARRHGKVLVRVGEAVQRGVAVAYGVVLGVADEIGQPPGLTGPENAELQRLIAGYTGTFMTKCGSVTATRSGAFTAYATEHCAWIRVGALE